MHSRSYEAPTPSTSMRVADARSTTGGVFKVTSTSENVDATSFPSASINTASRRRLYVPVPFSTFSRTAILDVSIGVNKLTGFLKSTRCADVSLHRYRKRRPAVSPVDVVVCAAM
jgi:hypothetical protein